MTLFMSFTQASSKGRWRFNSAIPAGRAQAVASIEKLIGLLFRSAQSLRPHTYDMGKLWRGPKASTAAKADKCHARRSSDLQFRRKRVPAGASPRIEPSEHSISPSKSTLRVLRAAAPSKVCQGITSLICPTATMRDGAACTALGRRSPSSKRIHEMTGWDSQTCHQRALV